MNEVAKSTARTEIEVGTVTIEGTEVATMTVIEVTVTDATMTGVHPGRMMQSVDRTEAVTAKIGLLVDAMTTLWLLMVLLEVTTVAGETMVVVVEIMVAVVEIMVVVAGIINEVEVGTEGEAKNAARMEWARPNAEVLHPPMLFQSL